ncbi:hypothetical protein FOA52_005446 [Chlamydomonas sp. UWO 241]|nr:hypothetical protein FOA52_005446 [Chlamydomonas sp. UWO 241]
MLNSTNPPTYPALYPPSGATMPAYPPADSPLIPIATPPESTPLNTTAAEVEEGMSAEGNTTEAETAANATAIPPENRPIPYSLAVPTPKATTPTPPKTTPPASAPTPGGKPAPALVLRPDAGTMTADAKPAGTVPADTMPTEATPTQATPKDATPKDATPADTMPADAMPANAKPANTTSAETIPVDDTPAGMKTPNATAAPPAPKAADKEAAGGPDLATRMVKCTDVAPNSDYTCANQAMFGKCAQPWMAEMQYCDKTCGRLPCCGDLTPPGTGYTCEEQAKFPGKCDEVWMVQGGYCRKACGACT